MYPKALDQLQRLAIWRVIIKRPVISLISSISSTSLIYSSPLLQQSSIPVRHRCTRTAIQHCSLPGSSTPAASHLVIWPFSSLMGSWGCPCMRPSRSPLHVPSHTPVPLLQSPDIIHPHPATYQVHYCLLDTPVPWTCGRVVNDPPAVETLKVSMSNKVILTIWRECAICLVIWMQTCTKLSRPLFYVPFHTPAPPEHRRSSSIAPHEPEAREKPAAHPPWRHGQVAPSEETLNTKP